MKVVLLNPNTGQKERIENEAAWPPLGLLYLGTVLQRAGHEVKVIDNARTRSPVEQVASRVTEENAEVLGVSALTPTFNQGIRLAKAIKERDPEIKVIFGNYHATFEYERLLKTYPMVDCVVLGEGERTLLELIGTIEKGLRIERVRGIAFRRGRKVVKTPPRQFVEKLDELPFPDRGLLEHEYHSEIVGLLGSGGKFTTLLTSRGCPYACKYCACSAFSSRRVRFRTPENVVEEMEMLFSEGYEDVGFVDDNLLLDRKRMMRICELLRVRKIRLNLWAEGRTDQASMEMLSEFARAGCKTLYFGIESGNQRVLDYYGKTITPEMSRRAVWNSKRAGIENVIGSFIVGAPIETQKDVEQTFDFALGLRGMDFPQMNVLNLSPGMELYDTAIRSGYLRDDECWDVPVAAVEVFPSQIREAELEEMIDCFYRRFIERPGYLLHQFLKTVKSEYRLKILLANLRARTSISSIRRLWGG